VVISRVDPHDGEFGWRTKGDLPTLSEFTCVALISQTPEDPNVHDYLFGRGEDDLLSLPA
jgi:hypothetical protein